MKFLAPVGVLALALVLGVLVVGYGVALPMLDAGAGLIDPNLARALAAPIAGRLAELLLGASVVAALCLPLVAPTALCRGAAWLLVGAAAAHRLLILPSVDAAWSRVDRLTMQPAPLADEALRWTQAQTWTLAGAALVALALVVVMTTRHRPAATDDK